MAWPAWHQVSQEVGARRDAMRNSGPTDCTLAARLPEERARTSLCAHQPTEPLRPSAAAPPAGKLSHIKLSRPLRLPKASGRQGGSARLLACVLVCVHRAAAVAAAAAAAAAAAGAEATGAAGIGQLFSASKLGCCGCNTSCS